MNHGPCQTCKSKNVAYAYFSLGSHFSLSMLGDVYQGELPMNINLGEGRNIKFKICMDCGQVQGEWPIKKSISDMRKEDKVTDDIISPDPQKAKKKVVKKKTSKATKKEG